MLRNTQRMTPTQARLNIRSKMNVTHQNTINIHPTRVLPVPVPLLIRREPQPVLLRTIIIEKKPKPVHPLQRLLDNIAEHRREQAQEDRVNRVVNALKNLKPSSFKVEDDATAKLRELEMQNLKDAIDRVEREQNSPLGKQFPFLLFFTIMTIGFMGIVASLLFMCIDWCEQPYYTPRRSSIDSISSDWSDDSDDEEFRKIMRNARNLRMEADEVYAANCRPEIVIAGEALDCIAEEATADANFPAETHDAMETHETWIQPDSESEHAL